MQVERASGSVSGGTGAGAPLVLAAAVPPPPPVLVGVGLEITATALVLVRGRESIGTTISIGCMETFPAIWISTRTAAGRFVLIEVGSVVSQVSFHCVPS